MPILLKRILYGHFDIIQRGIWAEFTHVSHNP